MCLFSGGWAGDQSVEIEPVLSQSPDSWITISHTDILSHAVVEKELLIVAPEMFAHDSAFWRSVEIILENIFGRKKTKLYKNLKNIGGWGGGGVVPNCLLRM